MKPESVNLMALSKNKSKQKIINFFNYSRGCKLFASIFDDHCRLLME